MARCNPAIYLLLQRRRLSPSSWLMTCWIALARSTSTWLSKIMVYRKWTSGPFSCSWSDKERRSSMFTPALSQMSFNMIHHQWHSCVIVAFAGHRALWSHFGRLACAFWGDRGSGWGWNIQISVFSSSLKEARSSAAFLRNGGESSRDIIQDQVQERRGFDGRVSQDGRQLFTLGQDRARGGMLVVCILLRRFLLSPGCRCLKLVWKLGGRALKSLILCPSSGPPT